MLIADKISTIISEMQKKFFVFLLLRIFLYLCNRKRKELLAQLVQSTALTGQGSSVQVRHSSQISP